MLHHKVLSRIYHHTRLFQSCDTKSRHATTLTAQNYRKPLLRRILVATGIAAFFGIGYEVASSTELDEISTSLNASIEQFQSYLTDPLHFWRYLIWPKAETSSETFVVSYRSLSRPSEKKVEVIEKIESPPEVKKPIWRRPVRETPEQEEYRRKEAIYNMHYHWDRVMHFPLTNNVEQLDSNVYPLRVDRRFWDYLGTNSVDIEWPAYKDDEFFPDMGLPLPDYSKQRDRVRKLVDRELRYEGDWWEDDEDD